MAKKKLEGMNQKEILDILEQAQVDLILKYLKWSGRYTYSSWKISHKKILEIEKQAIIGRRIQANPAYMLREAQKTGTFVQKVLNDFENRDVRAESA